jgi:methionine-rich copper-binding protein CopC
MKIVAAFLTPLFASALLGMVPAEVSAHGYLVDSFPGAKTHLAASPQRIRLRFSIRADALYSTLNLEADDGSVLATQIQRDASRDLQMSAPQLPPGRYHVRYRVLSTDGDLVQGKVDFEIDD